MRRLAPALIAGLLLTGSPSAFPAAPALVSRLNVVSVHVKDAATFDAVFLFFRDVLRLPLLYGQQSTPGRVGRLYSGFSVGNAYIEPCGPYGDDAPYSDDQPARFHGLTFASGRPLAHAPAELDSRQIAHAGLIGGQAQTGFVYLKGPLGSDRQAVSLWEVRDPGDRVQPAFLALSLDDARGGALGVARLAEVRVAYPSGPILEAWRTLLAPDRASEGLWKPAAGPAIRLVAGKTAAIESILLDVRSLESAKRALEQRGLLGPVSAASAWMDPAKVWGLKIEVREASSWTTRAQ